MSQIDEKKERDLKIKIIAKFFSISIGIILILNIFVLPSFESVCDIKPIDYKDSPMDKAGLSIEEARESCKSMLSQLHYGTLMFLLIPGLTIWFLFFADRKYEKEQKEWFQNYNGKCGRCSTTVTWMETWWDSDNKRPVCENCAMILFPDEVRK